MFHLKKTKTASLSGAVDEACFTYFYVCEHSDRRSRLSSSRSELLAAEFATAVIAVSANLICCLTTSCCISASKHSLVLAGSAGNVSYQTVTADYSLAILFSSVGG